MKKNDLINFFRTQRQIFGTCPNTNTLFRLSDCHIYVKKKPTPDWMQGIEASQKKMDKASEKLDEKEESIREKARAAGRDEANRVVNRIDKIFKPRKINPDDSKVIFHPVDFIIFNGMKVGSMKNLILLDKPQNTPNEKRLQRSIINAVEKEKYEWVTLRIEENGNIKEE